MKINSIEACQAESLEAGQLKKTIVHRSGICFPQSSSVLILPFLFLFLTIRAQCQESADSRPKRNQFQIGLGANYIKTLDLLYSPKMYKSLRTDVHLGYSHKSLSGIFSTDLNVFLGALKPNTGSAVVIYAKETDIDGTESIEHKELPISQVGLNLRLGYLYKMPKLQGPFTAFYLGGGLEESLTYTPGFINVGVINYASLNAKARFDYFLKNGKPIIFEVAIPVVSMITRLPYHQSPGAPDQSSLGAFFTGNNKVETFNHFQNVRFSITYPLVVRKRMALHITYQAAWMHYYKPKHLTEAGNQLSLDLTF